MVSRFRYIRNAYDNPMRCLSFTGFSAIMLAIASINTDVSFLVSDQHQAYIKEQFGKRITDAEGRKACCSFFDSHVDVNHVKSICPQGVYSILSIDLGGSFLKMSKITFKFNPVDELNSLQEVASCIEIVNKQKPVIYEYPDTSKIHNDERPYWNDWVADKVLEAYDQDSLSEIKHASLIFSYPMKQTAINYAVVDKLAKGFCFRESASMFKTNVVDLLNESLSYKRISIVVNSVMNDSVAVFLGGVLDTRCSGDEVIGVIVGTGTNAAFVVISEDDKKATLYSSEWAQTEMPRDMLTNADITIIEDLKKKYISYNIVDVLIGGYKLSDILTEELISIYPEYIEHREVVPLLLNAIFKPSPSPEQKKLRDDHLVIHGALTMLLHNFQVRGAKIITSMISAIVEHNRERKKHFKLILEGAAFNDAKFICMLGDYLKNACEGIEFELLWQHDVLLHGSVLMYTIS